MISKTISLLTSCYHGQQYLPSFFANVLEQTVFTQIEIVMVLNEPTAEELACVHDFQRQYPDQLQYHIVQPVEPLGCSWNRAWKCARGKYVGMWNIDDQRAPVSLEKQAFILENDPDTELVYGDYVIVPQYGLESGTLRITPEYKKHLFSREFPSGGAFLLWRKILAEKMGYFDEQLTCAVDYDLVVRMAMAGYKMRRAEGVMGYFTDSHQGLSTLGDKAQIERTVIQYRYGAFDLIRPQWKKNAQEYKIYAIENFGEWISADKFISNYWSLLKSKKSLWLMGYLRNAIRMFLSKTALLDKVYAWLRKKSFKDYNS